MDFSLYSADDLRIVTDESYINEDGGRAICIYCVSLDAVTFVDAEEEPLLVARGVATIESLPE